MKEMVSEALGVAGETPRWFTPDERGWSPDDRRFDLIGCRDYFRLALNEDVKHYGDHELWVGNVRLGYVYPSSSGTWVGIAAVVSEPPFLLAGFQGPSDARAALEDHLIEHREHWLPAAEAEIDRWKDDDPKADAEFAVRNLYVVSVLEMYARKTA